MSKTVNLELLQRRVQVLQQMVALLTACCVGLAAFLWLFESRGNVRAAASESLRVKRLAVVDDKGTERIVIAAPLPDPVVQGERFKRNGAISGIAIYDPDGNERGGYATSETGSGALISLDSVNGEVFKVIANAEHKDGGTLFPFNSKHVGVVLTTHSQIYNDYKDHADFLTVYVREAHPTDEWQMKSNVKDDVCYAQPKTLEQRVAIARDFTARFKFPLPFGIDEMGNAADNAYAAWPERLYIIDGTGHLAYRGGTGPFNYKPAEVRDWLAAKYGTVKHEAPPAATASTTATPATASTPAPDKASATAPASATK